MADYSAYYMQYGQQYADYYAHYYNQQRQQGKLCNTFTIYSYLLMISH
jgi:hypothetical protein